MENRKSTAIYRHRTDDPAQWLPRAGLLVTENTQSSCGQRGPSAEDVMGPREPVVRTDQGRTSLHNGIDPPP